MKKSIVPVLVIIIGLLSACGPSEEEIAADLTQIAQEVLTTQQAQITPTPTVGVGSTHLSEKDGMFMVYVPGGEYTIGSNEEELAWALKTCKRCKFEDYLDNEIPEQKVTLDPFWIDQTEVTNAMFEKFVEETGYQTNAERTKAGITRTILDTYTYAVSWRDPHVEHTDLQERMTHPVAQVSWLDAWAYCDWAGKRLPTEAEWEAAASGPESLAFPWGIEFSMDAFDNFADANYDISYQNESIDDGWEYTAPVSNYPNAASPLQVYGMGGNVREWVYDSFEPGKNDLPAGINPFNNEDPLWRVIKGGSYHMEYALMRASARDSGPLYFSSEDVGFRCAASELELPAPPAAQDLPELILITPSLEIYPTYNPRFFGSDPISEMTWDNMGDFEVVGQYNLGEWLKVRSDALNEGWVHRHSLYLAYNKLFDDLEAVYFRPDHGFPLQENPDEETVIGPNSNFIIKPGLGVLNVNNPTDEDVYLTLRGTGWSYDKVYGWYIRANSQITLKKILDGEYVMYVTSGVNWIPAIKRFADSDTYYKLEDSLSFVTELPNYTVWSISLEEVEGGNTPSVAINPDQFPD